MPSLYLLIDCLSLAGPLIASFSPRIRFYRLLGPFLCANLSVGALFIAWDILFTHLGVWNFNPRYVEGIYFFHLPVEEWLFFICIPFSCVFTYYCLDRFDGLDRVPTVTAPVEVAIVGGLAALAVIFHDRLYTCSAFASAALGCLVIQFLGNGRLLGKIITSYAVLLLPFFLVNGILTGTGLPEPVVRYNNAENLGIRLLTIPVEDIFYGFTLISLHIVLFEIFAVRLAIGKSVAGRTPPEATIRKF